MGIREQCQTSDAAMTAGLWRRTEVELIDRLDGAVHAQHAQEIDMLRCIVELARRGTALGNSAHVANHICRGSTMTSYAARGLVAFAQRLYERPLVFEAYADEQIPKSAATTIMDFLRCPPAAMPADEVADAEPVLIDYARTHGRWDLLAMINGLRDHYTPVPGTRSGGADGSGPGSHRGEDTGDGHDEAADGEDSGSASGAAPVRRRAGNFGGDDTTRNTLFLSRTLGGRYALNGDLDAETGERLSAALSPLSAPRPEADGTRDRRTAAKRRADGLAEYLRRHACCPAADRPSATGRGSGPGDGPARGDSAGAAGDTAGGGSAHDSSGGHDFGGGTGTGSTLSVHVRLRTLADPDADHVRRAELIAAGRYADVFDDLPHGMTEWFSAIPVSAVRRLACDAAVTPVGVDGHGAPLNVGRTRRLATTGQRRALAARDHGCAFPRCDRPPAWCIAHHVRHWVDGGPTDMDNLVSLCTEHHRSVHHHGWTVIVDPETRHPRFLPPPGDRLAEQWLDADGAPTAAPETQASEVP